MSRGPYHHECCPNINRRISPSDIQSVKNQALEEKYYYFVKLTIHHSRVLHPEYRILRFFDQLIYQCSVLLSEMRSIPIIIMGFVVLASAKPFRRFLDCSAQKRVTSVVCQTYAELCCDSTSWIDCDDHGNLGFHTCKEGTTCTDVPLGGQLPCPEPNS